jgi:hypothetical protein
VLHAARVDGRSAEAAALVAPVPVDRYALFEPPLLIDVALTKADAGDVEDAALACTEVLTAAPAYAPGHYCLARVAQVQKDWATSFREYREFLDRWSDADKDHRWVIDAKRRIAQVAKGAAGAAAP